MFYLIQFIKIAKSVPVRAFVFAFLTGLLIISSGAKNSFEAKLHSSFPTDISGPYFYALISAKENHLRYLRKIAQLPGVQKVFTLSQEKIRGQVKEIMGNFDLGLSSEVFNLDYVGMKIVFKNEIQQRTQNLIRDYLSRLVGKKDITLGATRDPDVQAKKGHELLLFVKKWSFHTFIFIAIAAWVISLLSLKKSISEVSYVIEQFQRKKKVGYKIIFSAIVALIALSLLPLLIMQNNQWGIVGIISTFMILSAFVFLHKQSWSI